jgi:hypothetical protein
MQERFDGTGKVPADVDADEAVAARVAQPLKTPVALDESFEARLAAAIRATASPVERSDTRARGWWTRPRTMQLSPLAGLALAASIAGIAIIGTLIARTPDLLRLTNAAGTMAQAPSVVHVVRFVFVDSAAHDVALVGDFNAWNPSRDDLQPTGSHGAWTISIPLAPGRHEYAFVVDGKRWVADPYATAVHDDFDTPSSVIQLNADASSHAA